MKARIDAGQEVDPADADRFEAMVTTAVNDLHRSRAPQPVAHPWSDAEAHDVYTRINRDPASVTDQFAAWTAQRTRPTLEPGQVPRSRARTPRSRTATPTSRPAGRQASKPTPPSSPRSSRRSARPSPTTPPSSKPGSRPGSSTTAAPGTRKHQRHA